MAVVILKKGSQGPEVVDLQFIMQKIDGGKFNPGTADGIFGDKTRTAVINFQTSRKLSPDGEAGPKTWEAMTGGGWPDNKPGTFLKEGEQGNTIKKLQEGLKFKGVYTGTADGIFGAKTKEAAIKVQKSKTPPQTNTAGVVGIMTWRDIFPPF